MQKANLDGVELRYETVGAGDPVLLIGTGPFADSFLPFVSDDTLTGSFRLILYHQRGQTDGGAPANPVPFEEHASDAAKLLDHLGVSRAHVAGHSTGAAIALQLAVDRTDLVHSLVLFEPPLMSVESAGDFLEKIQPALMSHASGDRRSAMSRFLSAVSGLEWANCETQVEATVPGGIEQAVENADNFFGSYLPALEAWEFGIEQARSISQPVLAVQGTETDPLFAEGLALLRQWLPRVEDCRVEGVGHLLHMQRPEPVTRGVAAFLLRHRISR